MSQDQNHARTSRRAFLGVVSGVAAGLAGCFGDDTPTDAGGPGQNPGATDTTTPTATSTPTPTAGTPEEVVEMGDDRSFDPQAVVIDPGDTVEWTNEGSESHTVTADVSSVPDAGAYFASGGFDSEVDAREDWTGSREGEIAPGESYRHTFDTRGLYEYFCIPHETEEMFGFVEVGNPTPTTEN